MLIPDLILLAGVLALAVWRLIAPDRWPGLRVAAAGLGLMLAAAKWALYGFTWQDIPAWLLLALSALPPVRTEAVLRWIGRLGLVGVAAACIGVWILPAVPTLPPPDGPGRATYGQYTRPPQRDRPGLVSDHAPRKFQGARESSLY